MGSRYFVLLSNMIDLVQMADDSYVGGEYEMAFTSIFANYYKYLYILLYIIFNII
jgi:hypothetical protein